MLQLFAVLLVLGVMTVPAAAAPLAADRRETVVLLHGLGQSRFSMLPLERALHRAGYRTVNRSYPTRRAALDAIAGTWLRDLVAAEAGPDRTPRVHFVTHSMGGIVLRLWLDGAGAPPHLGRTVMIAPPNRGSEMSDRLAPWAPFRWLLGPNLGRLGTARDALPQTLGPWPVAAELGIIAGTKPLPPLRFSPVPRPHDGLVAVAATHLAGARDHTRLPYSHSGILFRRATAAQVAAFLQTGAFAGRPD